ncbi:MAG: DUF6691 family protein [Paraburkholderia sp.]|jgi:uncharacterized membrane protein YedE/YeeE|uniref:DUF6691 family protein n=1 Tax=Paraburkholderia sp. TaxID=1926495 RepID=UPI00397A59ED
MALLTAFLSGLLFGVGLLVSGMANPAKVLGFLDIAGRWDPSLIMVMAGAIAVGSAGFHFVRRSKESLLGLPMQIPAGTGVTKRLVLGSVVFGVGWGLAGFCPGPALVALGLGFPKAWGFVAAMLAGMAAFELIDRLKACRRQP